MVALGLMSHCEKPDKSPNRPREKVKVDQFFFPEDTAAIPAQTELRVGEWGMDREMEKAGVP